MSTDQDRQGDSRSLQLTLGAGNRGLPALRMPEIKDPYPGRRGKELGNQMREAAFRMYYTIVLERVAVESGIWLRAYAQQLVYQAVTQMMDSFYDLDCRPEALPYLRQFTEANIEEMVAQVRAILENHSRTMGGFY
jgi:hypothetical protein